MILSAIAERLKRRSKDDFKGRHFEASLILQAVSWYLRYSLSYRDIEELFRERGLAVDHSTLNRWVLAYAPLIERRLRSFRKPHCGSIRIDETYIKIRGQWRYLYQAIDEGHTKRDIVLLNKIEQAFSDALLGPADEQLWSQPPRAKRGRNAAPFRTVPVPPENCRDYPPQVLRWRLVTRSYRLNQRFPNRPCRVRENLIAVPFPHTQKMGTVFNPDSPDGSRRYHPRAWKSWRKHRFLLSPAARFTFSASDLASH